MSPNLSLNDPGFLGVAGAGDASYTSGLGSNGNWTSVTSLINNSDITAPSGLVSAGLTKSWLSNGSSTEISLTAGQIFPVDSDLTFCVWIYPTSIKTQVVLSSDVNYYFVVFFQQSGDRLEYIVKDGIGNQVGAEADYSWEADEWQMVACTFDVSAGQAIGYVYSSDGTKTEVINRTNTDVDSVATNTNWLMMGGISAGSTFAGRVLSPCIWNTVLSDSDLASLANSGNGADMTTIQKDKIVCYWDSQTGTAPITNLAIP